MGLYQTKKLLHSKTKQNKMKQNKKPDNKTQRQPTEYMILFVNDRSNKGLLSKYILKIIQLNTKQTIQLKMSRSEWTFFSRRHTNGQ